MQRSSIESNISEGLQKQIQVKRTIKNLFMKGLPVEDRNTKMTPKLKLMLRDRIDKINNFVVGNVPPPQQQQSGYQTPGVLKTFTSPAQSLVKSTDISAIVRTTASPKTRNYTASPYKTTGAMAEQQKSRQQVE